MPHGAFSHLYSDKSTILPISNSNNFAIKSAQEICYVGNPKLAHSIPIHDFVSKHLIVDYFLLFCIIFPPAFAAEHNFSIAFSSKTSTQGNMQIVLAFIFREGVIYLCVFEMCRTDFIRFINMWICDVIID